VWSGVLLFAGGFTTSIGAGMAFLDWPLSNGSLNPDGWLENQDQIAEHSHRLAGMIIGLLSLTLAVAFNRLEKRRWVRLIAYFLLLLIIFQGILGGLRVRLDTLNTGSDHNLIARSFAIAHAMGAQGVVLTLCSLTVLSAPRWFRSERATQGGGVRTIGVVSLCSLIVAILIGAVMRHNGAALAIQTFPAASADGSFFPTTHQFGVWVHFLHRTLGMIGGLGIVLYTVASFVRKSGHPYSRQFALIAVMLTGLQIWLGWLILQTARNPHVATIHMLNGAILLATLWAAILWSTRSPRMESSVPSNS
tara:strand:+ start:4036 stop:4953 length:918 start_codon:yes stop_codon:yes gene_type:complete